MIFLKLGGSLITEKDKPETCRHATLQRLASEIAEAIDRKPDLRLLLGHGSGSFGHYAAARHATHLGAATPADWHGFAEVWRAAQHLHRLVIDALSASGLPTIGFPPSATAVCSEGKIHTMAIEPLQRTLEAGLLPVVHGDVSFDRKLGATILSTESIFTYLATRMRPNRILLAGLEAGVYAHYPASNEILTVLTKDLIPDLRIEGAHAPDVTGGMLGKIESALDIAHLDPSIEVRIFSGEEPGAVAAALMGASPGTLISSE
ncbi:MAG: uridylate kinase [Anaerolineales bacterium]|nr:uridylate kinase [Anaerolineales bacterium]